ncbi:TolC family protein [Halobacillus litoralis]|uniref:TolC family protein n=1 Tax=Halobacillus litoralis TaxID=45668 RepID=UPI001CD33815|nr:TolC family protein [Halobacillus litoralis]MCA0970963.1 TolC family protein [Halobacillus litoralis]
MKKRNRLMIIALATASIPVGFVAADGIESWSFNEAAEEIEENDLGSQIQNDLPEIDSDSQAYQSNFSDELSEIQDVQNQNSNFQQEKAAELSAYTTLWNYWTAEQNKQISKANLGKALDELEIVKVERKNGVASEMDVIQSEMNVTNANVSLENAQQGVKLSQFQVNQKLNQPLDTPITLEDIPDPGVVPEELYNVSTYESMIKNHASLDTLKKQVAVYEDIVSQVDNLTVLGGSDMRKQIENLEDQIAQIENQIEELAEVKEVLPETLPPDAGTDSSQGPRTKQEAQAQIDKLVGQLSTLDDQLEDAEDRYDDAISDRNVAEQELEEYYKVELQNARIRLQQQENALELLLNQYAEQLKTLDTQIKSYESNVEKAQALYEKTEALLNNGMITPSQLEDSRLSIQNQQLSLKQAEKDYAVKKKELTLFLDGYLPQGG